MRILFVEDSHTDLELAVREIKKFGIQFEYRVVETPDAFLESLKTFSPDIVISDYSMPHFDGMRALTLSLERDPLLPFIILTGSQNESVAVACMKAGASDYVLKEYIARLPFAIKESLMEYEEHREKEAMTEALRKANVAKNELLATVSHELRTPLHSIIGFANVVDEMLEENSPAKRYMEIIQSSADQLLFLVNQLLDFSSIESKQLSLNECDFDVAAAVEECLQMVERELSPCVALHSKIEIEKGKTVRGDPFRVRQIFLNLLSNAAHFTAAGEIRVEATETAEEDNFSRFSFKVADTGCGIEESFLTKIFSPFAQENGDPLRPHRGAGLGLALSKKLAEAMGGTITVKSKVGVGSEFIVTLRLKRS